MQALIAVEFMPSEEFMLMCADAVIRRLQTNHPHMDLATTSELMLTLINLKFKPGPDLMNMVSSVSIDSALAGTMFTVSAAYKRCGTKTE